MRKIHRFTLFSVAILCLNCRAGWFAKNDEVRTSPVKRIDLVQQVTVSGTIIPNRRTMFTPPYNGYVKKIFVDLGSEVKAGSPVVSLSQSLRGEDDAKPLRAPFSGTVVQVLKTEGEYVEQSKEN